MSNEPLRTEILGILTSEGDPDESVKHAADIAHAAIRKGMPVKDVIKLLGEPSERLPGGDLMAQYFQEHAGGVVPAHYQNAIDSGVEYWTYDLLGVAFRLSIRLTVSGNMVQSFEVAWKETEARREAEAPRRKAEEKRRKEEEARQKAEDERRASVQATRKLSGKCTMCGQRLGFFLKIVGKDRHGGCMTFRE